MIHPSPPPAWVRWSVPLYLVGFGLVILSNVQGVDLDLFHEMALVRYVLETGAFPREDVFAYTSTVTPFVHHEWATGAVVYFVTVTLGLGLTGLALLRLALLAGIVAGCVAVARRRGAGGAELAVLAPLGILLMWSGLSPVRAHLFTFLLLVLLLWFLERDRTGSRWWMAGWALAFVAWVNLHGGFVVGLGMLGLYTVESLARTGHRAGWSKALRTHGHLVAATIGTLPLILVNPYGADYVPYLWDALRLERPMIPEWRPLWVGANRTGILPFWIATVLLAAYAWLRADRSVRRMPALLLLAAAGFMALRTARILPIWAIVWMAYVPPLLATTPLAALLRRLWQSHQRPLAAIHLVVGIALVAAAVSRGAPNVVLPTGPSDRNPFPAGAVAYLEDVGFQGNLMTPFGVGAYVSWVAFPAVKVGLDSRYEVAFDPAFVDEGMRVYAGETPPGAWRDFLARTRTDVVLVRTTGPFHDQLADEASGSATTWTEVYRDDAYALFARPDAAVGLPATDRRGQPISGRFP